MSARSPAAASLVRFGVFEVDIQAGELRRNGAKVKLDGQPLTILTMLLARPGQVVTREELKEKLWPADTFVDFEHGINVAVKRLREALQDSATTPRFIETLPRRGYRFIYPLNGAAISAASTATGPTRLRQTLVALGVVIGIAASFWLGPRVRDRLLGRPAPGTIKRIAVLPFHAQSSDPQQAYLAEGFTEMIITELGRYGTPEVLSHQSVLQYEKSQKRAPEIAKELGVDCVVEGTVLRLGNRVRVTVNVIVFPERHLLATPIEADLGDVFAVQQDVATAVAREIRLTIPASQRQRLITRPVSPQVAEAILRGFTHYKKGTDPDRAKAAEWFAKAVELDPNCALAYAYLAILNVHGGAARQGGRPENRKSARQWAEKALLLDEYSAEAHAALAWLELSDWKFFEAEREFQRAIELNPNFLTARTWYAQLLAAEGRTNDVAAQAAVVLQLDPVGSNNVVHAAWSLLAVGKVDEAITHLKGILELDPDYVFAHRFLAEAYLREGRYQDAITELTSPSNGQPESLPSGMLAYAYSKAGQRRDAERIARELDARSKQASAQGQWIRPNVMVPAYLAVGKTDEAFTYLETAYRRHAPGIAFLTAEECYRPLRSDPRFADLVRRVGIPVDKAQ